MQYFMITYNVSFSISWNDHKDTATTYYKCEDFVFNQFNEAVVMRMSSGEATCDKVWVDSILLMRTVTEKEYQINEMRHL